MKRFKLLHIPSARFIQYISEYKGCSVHGSAFNNTFRWKLELAPLMITNINSIDGCDPEFCTELRIVTDENEYEELISMYNNEYWWAAPVAHFEWIEVDDV